MVPRILAATLVVCALAGCGSSGHPRTASTSSSPASPSGPTSTLDASASSSLDANGATAVLTLLASQLKAADPTVTQEQADCIPPAVLARMSPQELFAVIDAAQGTLSPEQVAKVTDALRSCGLTDDQIAKLRLS